MFVHRRNFYTHTHRIRLYGTSQSLLDFTLFTLDSRVSHVSRTARRVASQHSVASRVASRQIGCRVALVALQLQLALAAVRRGCSIYKEHSCRAFTAPTSEVCLDSEAGLWLEENHVAVCTSSAFRGAAPSSRLAVVGLPCISHPLSSSSPLRPSIQERRIDLRAWSVQHIGHSAGSSSPAKRP